MGAGLLSAPVSLDRLLREDTKMYRGQVILSGRVTDTGGTDRNSAHE